MSNPPPLSNKYIHRIYLNIPWIFERISSKLFNTFDFKSENSVRHDNPGHVLKAIVSMLGFMKGFVFLCAILKFKIIRIWKNMNANYTVLFLFGAETLIIICLFSLNMERVLFRNGLRRLITIVITIGGGTGLAIINNFAQVILYSSF